MFFVVDVVLNDVQSGGPPAPFLGSSPSSLVAPPSPRSLVGCMACVSLLLTAHASFLLFWLGWHSLLTGVAGMLGFFLT